MQDRLEAQCDEIIEARRQRLFPCLVAAMAAYAGAGWAAKITDALEEVAGSALPGAPKTRPGARPGQVD